MRAMYVAVKTLLTFPGCVLATLAGMAIVAVATGGFTL